MTREVGAITGQVEAWFGGERVRIRYLGARDIYTVSGTTRGRTMDEVMTALTIDAGLDEFSNPPTVHLSVTRPDVSPRAQTRSACRP